MINRRGLLVGVGLVLTDTAVLVGFRHAPAAAWHAVLRTDSWTTATIDRSLAAVAAAGLWLVAAWLGVGLACTAIARASGAVGRCAGRLGRLLLPRLVLRLVAGSAGLGVLLAPVAAGAQPTTPPPGPSGTVSTPGPAWPSDRAVPPPHWPNGVSQPETATAPSRPAARARETVRVRTGDSLWLLAARRLGPDAGDAAVAREWPRWYAANRAVVGPDPSLLHPGDVLRVPSAEEAR